MNIAANFSLENLGGLSSDEYQERFLTNLVAELEKLKAQELARTDTQVTFNGRAFWASNWNILTQIDKGEIEISPSVVGVTISYRISFRIMLVIVTLGAVFGLGTILVGTAMPWTEQIAIIIGAWTLLFGVNAFVAIARFPDFIERIATQTRI